MTNRTGGVVVWWVRRVVWAVLLIPPVPALALNPTPEAFTSSWLGRPQEALVASGDASGLVATEGELEAVAAASSLWSGWSVTELVEASGLVIAQPHQAMWVARLPEASFLATMVEPEPQYALTNQAILLVYLKGDLVVPLVIDPGLGGVGVRLEVPGTAVAKRVVVREGGIELEDTDPFTPRALAERRQGLRASSLGLSASASGIREALDAVGCILRLLFSQYSFADLVCMSYQYTTCVITSAGSGVLGCLQVFFPCASF